MTQQPRQSDFLTELSSAMWRLEKDPHLRTTGSVMWLLDRAPDRKLVMDRLDRLSRMVPGFRHRLVPPPLGLATPRWVVDPDFDLSYHVRWIAAPQPKTLDSVLEYARQSAMSAFDAHRPPWLFTVIEGLDDDRAVVLYKLHHATMDGAGLLQMFSIIFDDDREPADLGPMPPAPTGRAVSRLTLTRDELQRVGTQTVRLSWALGSAVARKAPYALLRPVAAVKTVVGNVMALGQIVKPHLHTFSPLMVERHAWWRYAKFDVDFAAFHQGAKAAGATVNDAVMAAVGTGYALYHEAHGAPIERIHAAVAINVRRPEDPPYGNFINAGFVDMPVQTSITPQLMSQYHELILVARENASQPLAGALGVLWGRVGPALARAMTEHTEVAISHKPGPDIAYFCGAEVLEIFGFVPTFGAAATVGMLSYRAKCCVNVNADAAAVPDLDLLVDCLKQGFDQVVALAS